MNILRFRRLSYITFLGNDSNSEQIEEEDAEEGLHELALTLTYS